MAVKAPKRPKHMGQHFNNDSIMRMLQQFQGQHQQQDAGQGPMSSQSPQVIQALAQYKDAMNSMQNGNIPDFVNQLKDAIQRRVTDATGNLGANLGNLGQLGGTINSALGTLPADIGRQVQDLMGHLGLGGLPGGTPGGQNFMGPPTPAPNNMMPPMSPANGMVQNVGSQFQNTGGQTAIGNQSTTNMQQNMPGGNMPGGMPAMNAGGNNQLQLLSLLRNGTNQ